MMKWTQKASKTVYENNWIRVREEIQLTGGDSTFLYVPPGLAHVVISGSGDDVLLVVSAQPEVLRDEFKYAVQA